MSGFNFYGGGNTITPASQFGVNGSAFDFGQSATPDYSSLAGYTAGMPDTSLATPSATAGMGGFASSIGSGNTSGAFGISGLGANLPTLQLGLGGLSTLANLVSGIKAFGLAQDQFNFQKNLANKNLTNSVASYNTALTDRATARAVTEGQTAAQRDAYINANKLSA
jgi:hypothetical protein